MDSQKRRGLKLKKRVNWFSEVADSLQSVDRATRPIQYILRIDVRVQGIHDLPRLTLVFAVRRNRNLQLNLEIEEGLSHRIQIVLAGLGNDFVGRFLAGRGNLGSVWR